MLFRSLIISIHVPQVGHDLLMQREMMRLANFNPRAPGGARHDHIDAAYQPMDISIHVPQVGHDFWQHVEDETMPISIHVPQVGHDASQRN